MRPVTPSELRLCALSCEFSLGQQVWQWDDLLREDDGGNDDHPGHAHQPEHGEHRHQAEPYVLKLLFVHERLRASLRHVQALAAASHETDTQVAEPHAYTSAEEFLDARPVVPADCLILDIGLPGMSGPDLQWHLSSTSRQLPIVFITAFEESAERLRATAARLGARAFVSKPFGSNDLLEAVRHALVNND